MRKAVFIDEELHTQLKTKATIENKTMKQIVTKLIKNYLNPEITFDLFFSNFMEIYEGLIKQDELGYAWFDQLKVILMDKLHISETIFDENFDLIKANYPKLSIDVMISRKREWIKIEGD